MTPDSTSYLSDILPSGTAHSIGHWERPRLSHLIAGFRRDYLLEAAECTVGWRVPSYLAWFEKGDYLQNVDEQGRGGPQNAIQRALSRVLQPMLPASFVEWRYYAILTPAFHGIVGLSFFNPKGQFESLAEGGLLAIVAGTTGEGRESVCWQHMFPMSALRFGGSRCETLEGSHGGVTLSVDQRALNAARVEIGGPDAPMFAFDHVGLADCALAPFVVEDLKRVPGAHWIVHCPSPVAQVTGSFRFPAALLSSLGTRSERRYPNFVSDGLEAAARRGGHHEGEIHGSGYYEHSFGMNPLPLHGWDFMFAPDHELGAGLVMQTYNRSDAMRFIEVIWTENGQRKYTRFGKGDFSLEWSRSVSHPDIGAEIPMERRIVGSRGGYTLEIVNRIDEQLPFLRRKKFFVRHFFISEEMGRTSWVLRDAAGVVVASSREGGVPSGGEVAYPRIFTPGLG